MTEARIFKYRTNLARKMSSPGGLAIGKAITAAETGLEQRRADIMRDVAERVAWLETACVERRPGEGRALYEQAASILDMVGFFDTGPLYPAVFSLCDLADRLIETQRWDWPFVTVHVQAIRGILADDCRRTDETDRVLDGLAALLDRVPGAPG